MKTHFVLTHQHMRSMFIVVLLTMIVCSGPRVGAQGFSKTLDTFIEERMDAARITGLSAAIIRDDNVVWFGSYGFADKARRIPFQPTTIINTAGISKTVVGFCLMKAVEEGLLSLDEDVNKYLPFRVLNPFYPKGKITLRQLASHTSSIVDNPGVYNTTYHSGVDASETLENFLKNYLDPAGRTYRRENFSRRRSGSEFRYSNIATCLAAFVIERVAGEAFNEYSRRVLFDPVRMNDTGWLLSEVDLSNHARLYVVKNDSIAESQIYGLATYPDGGLRSSVFDLSNFVITLINEGIFKGGNVLNRALVSEMISGQFTSRSKPSNFDLREKNYGVFVPVWVKENRLGNTGSDIGVSNRMFFDPNRKVAVILLLNTSFEGDDDVLDTIFEEIWKYATDL